MSQNLHFVIFVLDSMFHEYKSDLILILCLVVQGILLQSSKTSMAQTNPEFKTEINEELENIGEKFNSLLTASSTRKCIGL